MGLFSDVVHFKDQNYDKLRAECRRSGQLFQDDAFPANQRSLGEGPKFSNVEWKRPGDLEDDPHLFVDGLNVHDVCQGGLGDCWFVSAMAVVASRKGYWQKVIPDYADQEWDPKKPEKYAGIFKFRFWRYGKWIQVVIDDLLPCRRGRLIYVSSKTPNEFWSALLEKAYAKLIGNYEMLVAGMAEEALVDFTGGVPEVLSDIQESYSTEEERQDLFRFLEREHDNQSLICASIQSQAGEMEGALPNGLVTTHAYSVTAVREVTTKGTGLFNLFNREKLQMMRLRNPWGAKEWNGAFSDNSEEWQRIGKSERNRMGLNFDDDGEFWMPFEDFAREFQSVTVLRLVNTSLFSLKKKWNETSFKGTFGPPTKDKPGALVNPQLGFYVTKDDEVLMDLIQEVPRGQEVAFGILLLQVEMGRKTRINNILYSDVIAQFAVDGARSLSKRASASAGFFVVVPFLLGDQTDANRSVSFHLRVFTSDENKGRILPAELPEPPLWRKLPCFSKPAVSVITRLTVVKAKALDASLEGGKPDPYVIVTCEGKTFRTNFVKDSVDPRWDEVFLFYRRHPENSPISMQIYNDNPMFDDFMGQCELAFDRSISSAETSRKLSLNGKNPDKDPAKPGTLYLRVGNFGAPSDL